MDDTVAPAQAGVTRIGLRLAQLWPVRGEKHFLCARVGRSFCPVVVDKDLDIEYNTDRK